MILLFREFTRFLWKMQTRGRPGFMWNLSNHLWICWKSHDGDIREKEIFLQSVSINLWRSSSSKQRFSCKFGLLGIIYGFQRYPFNEMNPKQTRCVQLVWQNIVICCKTRQNFAQLIKELLSSQFVGLWLGVFFIGHRERLFYDLRGVEFVKNRICALQLNVLTAS